VTRRGEPQRLGESVRALRAEAQPATLLAAVQSCWRQALGERVAAESRPVRERDGVITVECRAATWAQELDLMQNELLARLNGALGADRVTGLRLVVGEFAPSSHNSA
jgi:predicted nucleic acid-binding Zn ribbon protein